jgi:iron complex outermembrane receptor protein
MDGGVEMNELDERQHRSGIRWPALSTSFLAALAIAAHAQGPTTTATYGEYELEEIFVTGSRIARPDFESASPIVTVSRENFVATGATSVEMVMNRMPQLVPDQTNTSNNPGLTGEARVQLRGLSPYRTLVLLDGRRVVPSNSEGTVDVNIIPASLVESVEIITGGASAVYGADAVAGVINFKLKEEFQGLQFDGSYTRTEQGDGDDYSVGITAGTGFAEDRGSAYLYVGYTERSSVTYDEREISRYPLGYFGPGAGGIGPGGGFLPLGSGSIQEGTIPRLPASQEAFDALFESYGYPAGTVPYQREFGFNQDGSLFTMGDWETPGSVANFRGERDDFFFNDQRYSFNYASWNYLQMPLERVWSFGRGSFEFGSGHEVFAQGLYADYSAEMALAPSPAAPLWIPVSNPYVSPDLKFLLDSRADPAADLWLNKRLVELGPRTGLNEYAVYQLTAGIDGPLLDRWTYDAYAQYGRNTRKETLGGAVLRSRVHELTYAPDGGQSICGEFNLFGVDRISKDCAAYISGSAVNRQEYEQTILEATVSGTLADLPAGELRGVFGVMYKRDEFFYDGADVASAYLDDGLADWAGLNPYDDLSGSDHNTDLYVEALIPVLADRTAVRKLDVGLGYRYSDYKLAGGADTWKAELMYEPVDPLLLRSSLQRAVRVPNIFELYDPQLPQRWDADPFYGGGDPCEAGSEYRSGPDAAGVEALCLAQGVPAGLLPEFRDQDGAHFGVEGGNPDLEPETADTLTLGFVLRSWSSDPLWSSMQMSLDWYRIEIEDAIETVYFEDALNLCFDADVNPDFRASNLWCGFFSRDPATGEIAEITEILSNIDGFKVSGVDLQLDWQVPVGPGTAGFNAVVSWMDYFEYIEPPGLPTFNKVGYAGGLYYGRYWGIGDARPEWKWIVNLQYAWPSFAIGTRWNHVDGVRDLYELFSDEYEWEDPFKSVAVPSYDYFSLFLSYAAAEGVLAGLSFTAGVENLTDEDPPLMHSGPGPNTDASQYDVFGRRYYARLSYRF